MDFSRVPAGGNLDMEITNVQVEVLKVTLGRTYAAGGRKVDGNWHVLARVTTSDGTEGFGVQPQSMLEAL